MLFVHITVLQRHKRSSGFNSDFAIESDSHLPKKICVTYVIERPLKMIKNGFYFFLKALFVLKIFKFLRYLRYMLNFNFLEKDLGQVSPSYFVFDFSSKTFPILYSIKWPNFSVWFPLLLKISGNMWYCNCLLTKLWRHETWN